MVSSPTTVASSTANISTLTEQMMMLEIDDIDETNCSPESQIQNPSETTHENGMCEEEKHYKIQHDGQNNEQMISED